MNRRLGATSIDRGARRGFTLVEMLVAIGIIVVLAALTITASVALVEKSERGETETVLKQLELALAQWETRADRKLSWGVDQDPFDAYEPFDVSDGAPHVFTATQVLRRIRRMAEVRDILADIKSDFVYRYHKKKDGDWDIPPWLPAQVDMDDPDPLIQGSGGSFNPVVSLTTDQHERLLDELAILDAWGTPIRAVHPGRVANFVTYGDDEDGADPDGTVRLDAAFQGRNEAIYGVAKNRTVLFVSAGPDGKFGDVSKAVDSDWYKQTADNVYSYQPGPQ